MSGVKVCKKCQIEKEFSEFYSNGAKNSYKPNCKECTREMRRKPKVEITLEDVKCSKCAKGYPEVKFEKYPSGNFRTTCNNCRNNEAKNKVVIRRQNIPYLEVLTKMKNKYIPPSIIDHPLIMFPPSLRRVEIVKALDNGKGKNPLHWVNTINMDEFFDDEYPELDKTSPDYNEEIINYLVNEKTYEKEWGNYWKKLYPHSSKLVDEVKKQRYRILFENFEE